jgi:hypothetical protein
LIRAAATGLKDGKITLLRPQTSEECFRLLDGGGVDGVVEADLVGRASANTLGIHERVQMIDRPLALTSLHVAIAKSHPHARAILYYINTSLAKLRDTGEYERIVSRHLARFWETQTEVAKVVAGSTSDPLRSTPLLRKGWRRCLGRHGKRRRRSCAARQLETRPIWR